MSDNAATTKPDKQPAQPALPVREHPAIDLEGVRLNCFACGAKLLGSDLYLRQRVCPRCRYHYNMPARSHVDALADEGTFEETSTHIESLDPLEFSASVPYKSRVEQDQSRTGLQEAAVTGTCMIGGTPAVVIVLDFGFLGGSMGLVVGEKVALALELAAKKRLPAIAIITSGGARIQEGVLSLMQMAKTVLAVNALHEEGVPLISVLGNPATGQVLASFGSLADIILAEPGAHIGFAPYRTIQESSKAAEGKPDQEYASENFFEHGQVDRIVDRDRLKHELASLLEVLAPEFKQEAARKVRVTRPRLNPREPWEMVQMARRSDRPRASDYIKEVFSPFIELHGDRLYGDDPSVITGLGRLGAESVVVIGQQKSRPTPGGAKGQEGEASGLPAELRGEITPEGFRKAARAVHLAARFKLPVISLVDTPGPMLGLQMEQRGLANSIAGMITSMLQAEIPTISVLIGEGGSEAALAFGVADRVLMLQNAIYTPISPEGGAAAEHSDRERAARDMAKALRLTSADCLEMQVIDAVVPEPPEGAHGSPEEAARMLRRTLMRELVDLREAKVSGLVKRRRNKYRTMGELSHRSRDEARKEMRTWRSAMFRRRRRSKDAVAAAAKSGKPDEPAVSAKSEDKAKPGPAAVAVNGAVPVPAKKEEGAQQPQKRRSRLRSVFRRSTRRAERKPAEAKPAKEEAKAAKENASPGEDG